MKKANIKKLSLAAAALALVAGGTGIAVTANNYANASSNATSNTKTNNKSHATISQAKITQEQAVSKFTEKYGNKSINEIKLEAHKDKVIYKVEGFDNNKEYKVIIDATNGKVLKAKSKERHQDDKEIALDLNKVISSSQAQEIAKKQANGEVVELSLENENGKAVWEVKVINTTNKTMTKVEIDATSQKVLKVDKKTKGDHDKHHDGDHKHSKDKTTNKDKLAKKDRDRQHKDDNSSKSNNSTSTKNSNK